MKKSLKNIVLFIVVVSLGYWGIIYLLSNLKYKKTPLIVFTGNYYPSKGGHTHESINEFVRLKKVNLVFLGSSHAYRSFNPIIFDKNGINSFNLGTSGQSIEASELLFKRYILDKKPNFVVLELYKGQMEGDSGPNESSFDIAFNTPDYGICMDYIIQMKDWRFVNILHYKFFTKNDAVVYKDSTYVGRGFSIRVDSIKKELFKYDATFTPSNSKLNTLERIFKLAKENNIKIILVSQPMPEEYPIKAHSEFVKLISELLTKYDVPYFDYTFNHSLDSYNHFYDYNHLNNAGVTIFDSLLINNPSFNKIVNGK